MPPQPVEFLPANHAVQRLGEPIRAALSHAQESVIARAFPNARAFCARVLGDLKLSVSVPANLTKRPVTDISELPFAELGQFWRAQLVANGMPESAVPLHTINLAHRSQLVRAY